MFTEFLRIKPVLDPGTAKSMEKSLSQRFANVARRFGHGLKGIMKGTLLGVSLGLLNRLLNPLEAVEEKIKSLLGQGAEIRDLADRFGTSPGQLKRLQDVAQSLGVQPDQLRDMMTRYAEAVEAARKELADPFKERTAPAAAVEQFVGQKDLAEGFLQFISSLKSFEHRSDIERAVFGSQQFGAQRRLIDTDFGTQAAKINQPSAQRLNDAVVKNAALEDRRNEIAAQDGTADFLKSASKLNLQMIKDMQAAQAKEQDKLSDQLASYKDLRRGADAVEEMKQGLINLMSGMTQLLGHAKAVTEFIPKITTSRWWNRLLPKTGREWE